MGVFWRLGHSLTWLQGILLIVSPLLFLVNRFLGWHATQQWYEMVLLSSCFYSTDDTIKTMSQSGGQKMGFIFYRNLFFLQISRWFYTTIQPLLVVIFQPTNWFAIPMITYSIYMVKRRVKLNWNSSEDTPSSWSNYQIVWAIIAYWWWNPPT